MSLKRLRELSFTNNLENAVSNVSILYYESNKSINNIFNRAAVNVETSNSILWSRLVSFQDEVIQPSSTYKTSAEHVCFGENDGFWQLYFTYKGDDYKLERNDYELTLTSDCNQQDLKIDLYFSLNEQNNWDIKAGFQIITNKAKFNVVQGKQVSRMIEVWVRNRLDKDISCIYVIFSEGNTSLKETQPSLSRVGFEKNVLKSNDAVKSSKKLSYNCSEQFEHRLRFSFICGEEFYETECDIQKLDYSIKLTESDYGTTLDINVFQISKSKIVINVKTQNGSTDIPLKAENISIRESIIDHQALSVRKISTIGESLYGLKEALEKLAKETSNEDAPDKESMEARMTKNDSKVFYPSLQPKLRFEEDKLEGYKLKIPLQNKSIQPKIKSVVIRLECLKKEWNNFNESLDCLIKLVEPLEKLDEISKTVESIALVRSMNTIDILCKILIPSGWDEKGLTFYTSKSETTREISVDIRRLLKVVEEELDLWDMSLFSNVNAKSLKAEKTQEKKLKIYQKQYTRLLELFAIVREELIDSLLNTASVLHFQALVVNITTLSTSSVGIIGSGLAIAGLALAPFTAGASLAMAAVGAGVGVTTGAVANGTNITEEILIKKYLEPMVSLVVNDHYVFNLLIELVERQKLLVEMFSTFAEAEDYTKKLLLKYYVTCAVSNSVKANIQSAASNALPYFDIISLIKKLFGGSSVLDSLHKTNETQAASNALSVSVSDTLFSRFASAFGLVSGITTVVLKSIKLSRGGCSVLGYKLESDALLLRLELEEFKKIEDSRKEEAVKNKEERRLRRKCLNTVVEKIL